MNYLKKQCVTWAWVLVWTLCNHQLLFSQETTIMAELQQALDDTAIYDKQKGKILKTLKSELALSDSLDLEKRFGLYNHLFEQYKVFKSDSAYFFSLKTKEVADQLNDSSRINKAHLNLADIAISVGMYKEAVDYLKKINLKALTDNDKPMYYGLYGRCYSDMAEYSSLPDFSRKYTLEARYYRSKTLELTDQGSFFHAFMMAFNEYSAGNLDKSATKLTELAKLKLSLGEMALTHYVLGEIYDNQSKWDKAEFHYATAAIADIKNSTKESLAIIKLSELLFTRNKLEFASTLIQKANEDAKFYGAQQRKLQVGAILPLIEEEIVKTIETERKRLYWQYVSVVIFLVILILFTVIIFIQFKRLQKARTLIAKAHKSLKKAHAQLIVVNEQLKTRNIEIENVNARLLEANKIKEEYLGFFFTEYDNVFEKFNDLTTEIEKHLTQEDYKKASYQLSRYDLKKEKEKLLHNFDTAFIQLFPNYINEFNSLMKPEFQITLKSGQILNKELRIFALIRLGVKHNDKIAQILGYSVNSIYAYKSKIRNRSRVDNENFDQNLIDNTSINV